MKIELAVDHCDVDGFAAWLTQAGHDVIIGTSTGSYIDGNATSYDETASENLNNLWDEYSLNY